jgi:hypothetical protein
MLAAVYRNTQNSISWVKQYKNYAIGAVTRLTQAVQVVKESLRKERIRIIEEVLAGHVQPTIGSTSHDLPDFSADNYEAPPPVYEAPPLNEDPAIPSIPAHISSSPIADSFANLSLNDSPNTAACSPPNSYSQQTTNSSVPPPPPTTYISPNVNNPFRTQQ